MKMKDVVFVRGSSDSNDWRLKPPADDNASVVPASGIPADMPAIYTEVVIAEALKADPFSLQSVENFLTGAETITAGITDTNHANDAATVDDADQLAVFPHDVDTYFSKKAQQSLAGALASQKVQGSPTELETMLSDQERKERRHFIA
jgi:hypothetical protein